jgi:hypothetical protein
MKVFAPFLWAGGTLTVLALAVTLAGARATAAPDPPLAGGAARVPVVVELFTSEGCSSCPPADEVMTKLVSQQPVAGAEIIGIGEHVDYWDRLGWRDPFSSATFSARQSEYASRVFHTADIYTPQMVVDGREQFVGSDYRAATTAIARAASLPGARMQLALKVSHVSAPSAQVITQIESSVGVSLAGTAEVFLAVTEDGLVTQVRRGENGGRQLRHSAAARTITSVGVPRADGSSWSVTTNVRISPDWNLGRTRIVAFAQDRATKRILGATTASLLPSTEALKP